MVQLTFLVAVAAVAAHPGHGGTTRHLVPPSLRDKPAAEATVDEIGTGVRQVKYMAPTVAEYAEPEAIESMPIETEGSVLQYDATPAEYMSYATEAYYDRTSRRSDNYYHGCEQYCGFWAKRCMPSPWCCPGNMRQHFPYEAAPHFYYYFRPYNAAQIAPQQVVAEQWVSNPRLPYSNDVFDEVYRSFDAKFGPRAERINPLVP